MAKRAIVPILEQERWGVPAGVAYLSQTLPRGYDTVREGGGGNTSTPFNATAANVTLMHYDSGQFDAQQPILIADIAFRMIGAANAFNFPSVEVVAGDMSTDYKPTGHNTTFMSNFFSSQVVRAAAPLVGGPLPDSVNSWVSLGITPFQYNPGSGRDFGVLLRKCSTVAVVGTNVEGVSLPAMNVRGNRYAHLSNCASLVQNFANNEFVQLLRILYTLV